MELKEGNESEFQPLMAQEGHFGVHWNLAGEQKVRMYKEKADVL